MCYILFGIFLFPIAGCHLSPDQTIATCCVRLATLLQCVECCWLKFETGQIFHTTFVMLHDVSVVWPGSWGTHTTLIFNTQHVRTRHKRVAKFPFHLTLSLNIRFYGMLFGNSTISGFSRTFPRKFVCHLFPFREFRNVWSLLKPRPDDRNIATQHIATLWRYDWPTHLCTQLKQLWDQSLNKIQTWTGFEPMTSAIPVQCSTNWAIKPTGSWPRCGFVIYP